MHASAALFVRWRIESLIVFRKFADFNECTFFFYEKKNLANFVDRFDLSLRLGQKWFDFVIAFW
jgi:hypothetical protein